MAQQQSDPGSVFKWGLVVAGGYVVYTMLKKFGLIPSAALTEAGNLNDTIELKDYTSPNFWKQAAPSGYQSMIFTTASTPALIDKLWDAHGFFNDCEECIPAVIKQVNYKTQYSWLADNFQKKYNQDLTAYLKNYFSEQELYSSWKHLDSLPTYKKI